MDTIYAVSSGRPPAAIAVLRISGVDAFAAGTALAGKLPKPRRAGVRRLRDGTGETLDHALCLWFPKPDTVTGEDVVELHLHGGAAVIAAVERELASRPGLRVAEPGEFTRRGLVAGRTDLAQAQGLADLLQAETEQQRKLALGAAEGKLSDRIREILAMISAVSAEVEAAIDFDDEDDVADVTLNTLHHSVAELEARLSHLAAQPSLERLRDGVRIVLTGAPNAGKSSLFNALIGRDAAIVTPIAGTTRDVIEAKVVRNGQIFTFIDTAGVRPLEEAEDVERIGIERALAERRTADLILALDSDATEERSLGVRAKADLGGVDDPAKANVSIHRPESVEALWKEIILQTNAVLPPDWIALDQRQRSVMDTAVAILQTDGYSDDLLVVAEALRRAAVALARILGVDATEAMLDALFARFCVGK